MEVVTGRLEWELPGGVEGLYVYVWLEGQEPPSQDNPCAVLGSVNSVALAELYSAGCLPSTAEPVTVNLALAAFDRYGAVSELSDTVTFAWRVLENTELQ